MISRITLYSFLLAFLLAAGIKLHDLNRRDECAPYLAGQRSYPATELVVTGTRTMVVPCDQWLPRQSLEIQIVCLVDLVLAFIFAMNALLDLKRFFETRRPAR